MEELYRIILESVQKGKIDKVVASRLLDGLSTKMEKVEAPNQDVAIIGMAVSLPLTDDIYEFWDLIANKTDFIVPFPDLRRQDVLKYIRALDLDESVFAFKDGAYLERVDHFDYRFFRLSPKEASLMDPIQRLFLQTAWRAIEDAGYGGEKILGTNTGVFLGYAPIVIDHYLNMIHDVQPDLVPSAIVGNTNAVATGRLSYLLNLKGISAVIDTACSSSLVAVHSACQSIRNGDCEMAIAAGAKTSFFPILKKGEKIIDIGMDSSDARTWAFDENSDGTGSGEGVVAILLKSLDAAIRDRDHIHAVVKGSAVNQDGTSAGLTAPNPKSQEEVIVRAWKNAGIDPKTVSYVETHGTGTPIGDPIEIQGLTNAFRSYTDNKQFCAIGSVKTNIGHLYECAGLAGLVKVVMALKNKKLPPSINFHTPNKNIEFADTPFFVNTRLRDWEASEHPRRCGINGFGMSGTNCHVVLEEPPVMENVNESSLAKQYLFCLSAKSEVALHHLVTKFIGHLRKFQFDIRLDSLCYTVNTGRGHYSKRLCVIASTTESLIEQLESYCHNEAIWDDEGSSEFASRQTTVSVSDLVRRFRESPRTADLLEQLRDRYLSGDDIPWEQLYEGQTVRKISLPGYSFEPARCWLDIPVDRVRNDGRDRNFATQDRQTEAQRILPSAEERVEHHFSLNNKEEQKVTELEQQIGVIWHKHLGVQNLDVHEDFFELGGDSIMGIKIANDVNKKLGISINATTVLKFSTISQLAAFLDDQKQEESANSDSFAIHKTAVRGAYPVSTSQKRLYILHKIRQDTSLNVSSAALLTGKFDLEKFKEVIRKLANRHESLRTTFSWAEDAPVQVIHEALDIPIEYVETNEKDIPETLRRLVRPFDLQKGPLFRIIILRIDEERHLVFYDVHHIITDAASMDIMMGDVAKLYAGCELPALDIHYKDFSAWQIDRMDSRDYKAQEHYWLSQFESGYSCLQLPTDFPRPAFKSNHGARIGYWLDPDQVKKYRMQAAKSGSTLNMFMLTAYVVLLHRDSAQEDLIVGSPVFGRSHPSLDGVVGVFINMLSLRTYPQPNKTFMQFLSEIKETVLAGLENQEYPFDLLVERLNVPRDMGRHPIFDVTFNYLASTPSEIELGELKSEAFEFDNGSCQYDLSLEVVEREESLLLQVTYSMDLFEKETIECMIEDYLRILHFVKDDPAILIGDLQLNALNFADPETSEDFTLNL